MAKYIGKETLQSISELINGKISLMIEEISNSNESDEYKHGALDICNRVSVYKEKQIADLLSKLSEPNETEEKLKDIKRSLEEFQSTIKNKN